MNHLTFKKAKELISKFKQARVLVVGDLIMDHFIWGRVNRISPEAPVPVVKVVSESFMLGGAANVANNIRSLGGKVTLCGVIGRDDMGRGFVHELRTRGIPTEGIVVADGMPTTVKTRVIAHSQQVVRVDRERGDGIDRASTDGILDYCKKKVKKVNAIVISDYAKGVILKGLVEGLVDMAQEKVVAVDPKISHFDFYKGATIVTPNTEEATRASGVEIKDEASLLKAGKVLLDIVGSNAILITRGEHGMSLFEGYEKVTHLPTVAREVYDVTGAGDTVIGAIALALAVGATMKEAAVVANYAAGIVVGKVGTAAVTPKELEAAIGEGTSKGKKGSKQ
ncbi:MAG: D-glycero-beta-D-manno-heptose-7-phosphate kinase [Deltaproteobacteria bacterium]|nr:D-glycero-beta-D-manno-heptose-7-phosphate kinase [Deltaproteobacteria bacterium]